MRNSQYLETYIACNAKRGVGKGLTVGSYLAYKLRGSAKEYSGNYRRALQNSLERVGAVAGRSHGGRTAYYPSDVINAAKPTN